MLRGGQAWKEVTLFFYMEGRLMWVSGLFQFPMLPLNNCKENDVEK